MKINKMEDLAIAEPYELEHLQNRYRDNIRYARRNGEDTEAFELELSYVQREIHVRQLRDASAEKFNRSSFHYENRV
jgi:hypothetical protein